MYAGRLDFSDFAIFALLHLSTTRKSYHIFFSFANSCENLYFLGWTNMDRLEKGEKVVARTFGGGQVERRVWEDGGEVVYLCSERQYEALNRGWSAPTPIGF